MFINGDSKHNNELITSAKINKLPIKMLKLMDNKTTNFSSFKELDKGIIALGGKFIPPSTYLTSTEINNSFIKFQRDLLIELHDFKKQRLDHISKKLKTTSSWSPNITKDIQRRSVDTLRKIQTYILKRSSNYKNHQHQMIKYLKKLRKDTRIYVTNSDKNLGLVIFNKHDYIHAMNNMLVTDIVYEKLMNPNCITYMKEKVLKDFYNISELFTDTEAKFITNNKISTALPLLDLTYHGIFHGLPKIHKGLNPLKFRPIIAGRPSQLQAKVSTILTERLLPILQKYNDTILKNSLQLKNSIESVKAERLNLVSIDFVSLYTNIPLSDLYTQISYCKFMTNTQKDETINMLKFIFSNNFFLFNEEYYRQTDGIAMGTNVAPVIANLYLAIKFDRLITSLKGIFHFYRYIDDCFLLTDYNEEEFIKNIGKIEDIALPLKITYEFDSKSLNFLDITIYKNSDNEIKFKPYIKELNKFEYLPPFSFHNESTLKGFIKGELIRYNRLSSTIEDFNHIKYLFYNRLKNRGYSNNFLTRLFLEVQYGSSNCINPSSSIKQPIKNFIIRYSNQPILIRELQQKLKELLLNMNNYTKKKLIARIVFTKNYNISQILCHSDVAK